MLMDPSLSPSAPDDPDGQLRRVAKLLREIEDEAVRLAEGARGASALAIVSRAASARRYLGDLLDQDPPADPLVQAIAAGIARRIRSAVHELGLSTAAAANLAGTTEEEMSTVLRGTAAALPVDELERVATRLEAEQQLAMEPLV